MTPILQPQRNSTLQISRLACLALVLSLSGPLCFSVSAQEDAPRVHAPAHAEPWTKIPIPPLHAFKPQEPRRIELANGMVIFLQEDHELPFINGFIVIRGGSRDEPAQKIGLVSLYGQSWRTSGNSKTSGDVLDTQLAAKAARIETGGGQAWTSLHWSSLKGDFDPVFASAVDLLLHPAFNEAKLQLAKRQAAARISRRNDEAPSIASREAVKLVYGADSPYGRIPQYATIAAVKLDDLRAWHDRTVVPNNMMIAVSGDFDSAAMEAKLRAVFEPLPRGTQVEAPKLDFPGPKPGVYFVDKPDVNQSTVFTVGLGTRQDNPDYYALSVMNDIFSGGFGSRV
ncbi:MAG TPA: pitrilysin family protein, partial [Acidobacteriaceae bacterium]|nr:pitrilysin family protein [Acidobacteriaceae bacterium]